MDLQNAHVLVTGASRGIGAAMARRFARAGARVSVAARSADGLAVLVDEVDATSFPTDLLDPDQVDALIPPGGDRGRADRRAGQQRRRGGDRLAPRRRASRHPIGRSAEPGSAAGADPERSSPGMLERRRGSSRVHELAGRGRAGSPASPPTARRMAGLDELHGCAANGVEGHTAAHDGGCPRARSAPTCGTRSRTTRGMGAHGRQAPEVPADSREVARVPRQEDGGPPSKRSAATSEPPAG